MLFALSCQSFWKLFHFFLSLVSIWALFILFSLFFLIKLFWNFFHLSLVMQISAKCWTDWLSFFSFHFDKVLFELYNFLRNLVLCDENFRVRKFKFKFRICTIKKLYDLTIRHDVSLQQLAEHISLKYFYYPTFIDDLNSDIFTIITRNVRKLTQDSHTLYTKWNDIKLNRMNNPFHPVLLNFTVEEDDDPHAM